VSAIPHFVRLDFAYATRSVFLVMAAVMAAAALAGFAGLKRGRQEEESSERERESDAPAQPQPDLAPGAG
jgi:hypothetical protein